MNTEITLTEAANRSGININTLALELGVDVNSRARHDFGFLVGDAVIADTDFVVLETGRL